MSLESSILGKGCTSEAKALPPYGANSWIIQLFFSLRLCSIGGARHPETVPSEWRHSILSKRYGSTCLPSEGRSQGKLLHNQCPPPLPVQYGNSSCVFELVLQASLARAIDAAKIIFLGEIHHEVSFALVTVTETGNC